MKIKINKLIQTITAIALLGVLAGCAPSANGPSTGSGTAGTVQDTTEAKSYTLSGLLSFNAGAFPKDFVESKANGERTATSSFTTPTGDPSYTLKAVQGTTTVEGTIKNETNGATYSIVLPSTGTWELTATFLVYDEVICTGQTSITIEENSASTLSPKNIALSYNPQTDVHEKGSVNLTINTSASNLAKIDWRWVDSAYNGSRLVNGYSNTIENNTESVVFNFESVNPGAYNVELTFADSNGKTIYSCFETINIFAGMVTDAWCGNSPYINDKNEFVFNDTVRDSFVQNESRVDITDGAPLYALWSYYPYEVDTSTSTTPTENPTGIQIFDSITERMKITNPLSIDSAYSFYGSILYAPPFRYINSYTGFVEDPGFDLTNAVNEYFENLGNSEYPYFPYGAGCTIEDGYLYFVIGTTEDSENSPKKYYIGRYDIENEILAFTTDAVLTVSPSVSPSVSSNSPIFALAVTHNESVSTDKTSGVIYYAVQKTQQVMQGGGYPTIMLNYELNRISFDIDTSGEQQSIVLNNSPTDPDAMMPATFDISSTLGEGIETFTQLAISDIKILGDKLYVLVFTEGCSNRYEEYPSFYYKNGETDFIPFCDGYISNGGVLKFDVSSAAAAESAFVPENWTNQNTSNTFNKILGLYTLPDDRTYYYEDYIDYQATGTVTYTDIDDNEISITLVAPVQPPHAQANNYFYGPRKFLWAEDDQLIIVDDGGFIQNPEDKYSYDPIMTIPINRVVTLDLTTESITDVVNVDATFTAAYSSTNKFFTAN